MKSISHEYTVRDSLGAESTATVTIATTTLSLIDPGDKIILTEGEPAPKFNFFLSNPIEHDVEITASLSQSGFSKDVQILSATIPAGQLSVPGNAELIKVLSNPEELEKNVQSDNITISATVSGKTVPISVGSDSSEEHTYEIELTDRVIAGLEQSDYANAFGDIGLVKDSFFDLFNVLSVTEATLDLKKARGIADEFADKIGYVVDAASALANLEKNLDKASSLSGDAKYTQEYLAAEAFAVDLGGAAVKEIATKYGAAGLAAAAAVAFGVPTATVGLAAAIPVLATVAVGWTLGYTYDSFADKPVDQLLRDLFRSTVSLKSFKDFRKQIDDVQQDIPLGPVGLNEILGSDAEDLLVGSSSADFAFLGSGNDKYQTGGGNDVIATGLGNDVVTLSAGENTIIGTLEELSGDTVEGFSHDDQIVIRNVSISRQDLDVRVGSAILGIDSDGDGLEDGIVTLGGDFSGGDFLVSSNGENTIITFDAMSPDLTASNVVVSNTTLTTGGTTTITYDISNIGSESAIDTTAGIYLSTDSTVSTTDTLLATQLSSDSNNAGSVDPETQTITLPDNLAPGTYYVGVVADYNNQETGESDESNNASTSVAITVPGEISDRNGTHDSVYDISRFYNSATGAHFYTGNDAERDTLIASGGTFLYEGNAFDSNATIDTGLAVFRLFNTQTGVHFYTASAEERASIAANLPQFNDEGLAYYAYAEGGTDRQALHRFYNTENATHFYTASDAEQQQVVSTLPQYTYEGVAYYVEIA